MPARDSHRGIMPASCRTARIAVCVGSCGVSVSDTGRPAPQKGKNASSRGLTDLAHPHRPSTPAVVVILRVAVPDIGAATPDDVSRRPVRQRRVNAGRRGRGDMIAGRRRQDDVRGTAAPTARVEDFYLPDENKADLRRGRLDGRRRVPSYTQVSDRLQTDGWFTTAYSEELQER